MDFYGFTGILRDFILKITMSTENPITPKHLLKRFLKKRAGKNRLLQIIFQIIFSLLTMKNTINNKKKIYLINRNSLLIIRGKSKRVDEGGNPNRRGFNSSRL